MHPVKKPGRKQRAAVRRRAARPASEGDVMLEALDAAYTLETDDGAWLLALTRAVAPAFDRGLGMVSFFYDSSDPTRMQISRVTGHAVDPAVLPAVRPMVAAYSPELIARAFDGPTLVATALEAFGFGPPKIPFARPSAVQARALLDFGFPPALLRIMEHTRSGDTLAVRCQQPDGKGVFLSALLPTSEPPSARFRARWTRFAAHLLSAWRLRQRVAALATRAAPPEAILTPSGRLEGATFDPSAGQRRALASAVTQREQARGPLRHSGLDAALALWQGLVQGRWSLVDQIDRDGKRFVLARRNDPAAPLLAGLTLRERQVVALSLQGHANKHIAYSIGLAASTIGSHLGNATPKLDLATRQRLVRRRPARKGPAA